MGYRGKIIEKDRAQDLRQRGWTYREIVDELGVSKSSVSLRCRDVEVDPELLDAHRRRNYERANYTERPSRLRTEKLAQIERCRRDGVARMARITNAEHLQFGLGLYAGDGSKRDGGVSFANSNAAIIEFCCEWMRRHFDVEESRLRMRLYLHVGLDLDAAESHWSVTSGIPRSQFSKPYRAAADPTIRTAKHEFWCAHLSYSCSRTQRLILGLMGGLVQFDFLPG